MTTPSVPDFTPAENQISDGSFSIGSDVWPGVSKLIEECGELQQVLGKLIATHGDPDHWDGSNLRLRLIEEMADVNAAIRFISRLLTLDECLELDARFANKFQLFCEWQETQSS